MRLPSSIITTGNFGAISERLKISSHNVTLLVCRPIEHLYHTHQDLWRNSGPSQTTNRRDREHSISIFIIIKFSGFRTHTHTHARARARNGNSFDDDGKPIMDGLFCPKIFGSRNKTECLCKTPTLTQSF
ncbi:hypothetical protein, partial [Candidatus Hodgkinia cicadicola]|uniref:hypothetical protein n=1 Tax=Candidatus Hodgkinia cicadicola TaxID=573658 RepID=UPI0011BACC6B